MNWEVHYFDSRSNSDLVSRPFASQERAMRHACDLESKKIRVDYISGPDKQRIGPPAILAWCRAHRVPPPPSSSAG
jgi:hypothetical protein